MCLTHFMINGILMSRSFCICSRQVVVSERAAIWNFKISTEVKDKENIIGRLYCHIQRILNYYPHMLTETHKLFLEGVQSSWLIKDNRYEMTMSVKYLLVTSPINWNVLIIKMQCAQL